MSDRDQEKQIRKRSFDSVAELYARARPSPPPSLFEDLFERLPESPSILEVGCGPGTCSVHLAPRASKLICIELGENLAQVARRRLAPFPLAAVHVSPFEEWDSKGEHFDLVFASASWHWIDADQGYRKAHDLLKSDGHVAIVTGARHTKEDVDPFFAEIDKVYEEMSDERVEANPNTPPHLDPSMKEKIVVSGLFKVCEVLHYGWALVYPGDEYVALLGTYSDHILMPTEKREYLFGKVRELASKRPEGKIRRHHQVTLYLANKLI